MGGDFHWSVGATPHGMLFSYARRGVCWPGLSSVCLSVCHRHKKPPKIHQKSAFFGGFYALSRLFGTRFVLEPNNSSCCGKFEFIAFQRALQHYLGRVQYLRTASPTFRHLLLGSLQNLGKWGSLGRQCGGWSRAGWAGPGLGWPWPKCWPNSWPNFWPIFLARGK